MAEKFVIEEKTTAQEVIQFYDLKQRSKKGKDEITPIYPLPVHPHVLDGENKIRTCEYGNNTNTADPLILMVVGPTGSGKTTAINALINYLLGVQYEQKCRFELVSLEDDEKQKTKKKPYSQTQWVTVYKIFEWKDSPVKRPIFIVDTPGLDDTDGKEKDKQTVQQIKLLFEKYLSTIHAVCMTLNGTQASLTESQRYIYDSINKIFGKDIIGNFYIWATFSDLPNPEVTACLEEYNIKYEQLFTMENGTLYKKVPEDERTMNKCKNKFEEVHYFFKEFFNTVLLKKAPVSLENTKRVLQERENTESIKKEIEQEITNLINQLEEKDRLKSQLKTQKDDLQQLKRNIKFFVTTLHRDGNRKHKVNNCSQCKRTCCNPCSHNTLKQWMFQKCSEMSNDGYCKVCRCAISVHNRSTTDRYEVEEKSLIEIEEGLNHINIDEVTQINIRYKKEQLNKLSADISQTEASISTLDKDEHLLKYKLKILIEKLQSNINKIKELALHQENPNLIEIINEIKLKDKKHDELCRSECYQMLEDFAKELIGMK